LQNKKARHKVEQFEKFIEITPSIPLIIVSLIVEISKYKKRATRLSHSSLPMMDRYIIANKKSPSKCQGFDHYCHGIPVAV